MNWCIIILRVVTLFRLLNCHKPAPIPHYIDISRIHGVCNLVISRRLRVLIDVLVKFKLRPHWLCKNGNRILAVDQRN